ncbi:MAG: hypothetical protein HYW06_10815 [Gemmatimonadetes bacterium]|nr:hypothetical protein [Gemmatimonadota bacterium]MBI2537429.1 hypothetical protein [Gemmatimonadota bacterium]
MLRTRLIELGVIALLGTVVRSPLAAQDSTCSYDKCALALHRSFWSQYLVRGDSAIRVARIGFRAPTLAEFAAREDSAGVYVQRFRAHHTSGNWLLLVGALTAAAGELVVYQSREDVLGSGIMVVGLGVMITGGERARRGNNALQRAIWFYNRTLPR